MRRNRLSAFDGAKAAGLVVQARRPKVGMTDKRQPVVRMAQNRLTLATMYGMVVEIWYNTNQLK